MLLMNTGRRRALTLAVALFVLLALPSIGGAVANIEGVTPEALPDYDSRAAVEPSADQLAAADSLGATVT